MSEMASKLFTNNRDLKCLKVTFTERNWIIESPITDTHKPLTNTNLPISKQTKANPNMAESCSAATRPLARCGPSWSGTTAARTTTPRRRPGPPPRPPPCPAPTSSAERVQTDEVLLYLTPFLVHWAYMSQKWSGIRTFTSDLNNGFFQNKRF